MTDTPAQDDPLLTIEGLQVDFHTRHGVAHAVNGVSCHVNRGEMLAVLGESGSGKSVTAQAIMGILDAPPARVIGGSIRFRGVDLLGLTESQLRAYRGDQIAMIFQDALSALNPVASVGAQIAEMFIAHRNTNHAEAWKNAVALMDQVGIPAAATRAKEYPHQFSGGLRQRVMIAMALALDPALLIADEPTTALDVTIQAQILELIDQLRRERDMAVILITHDVGVVSDVADRIVVMYAGKVVESASAGEVLANPAHPYTSALLQSVPRWGQRGTRLQAVGGSPPNLTRLPPGCAFHPRCPIAVPICSQGIPPRVEVGEDHHALCHLARAK